MTVVTINGPLSVIPKGSWWVAEPDTPKPTHHVDARIGFVDTWPEGWTSAVPLPGMQARLEVRIGGWTRMFAWRPIPGLSTERAMMLGWQCACRCERMIAEAATMLDESRVELHSGPSGYPFHLHAAGSTKACGELLTWE